MTMTAEPGCVFCAIVASRAPAVVLLREDSCVAFLDLFPIARGHALVVPVEHAATLGELPTSVQRELFAMAGKVLEAQRLSGLPFSGGNLLLNDGRAANQHIPHVHVHVVPRTSGDLPRIVGGLVRRLLRGFGARASRKRLEETAVLLRPHLGAASDGG